MSYSPKDREVERERYNRRALHARFRGLGCDGAESVSVPLRGPYLVFERLVRSFSSNGCEVLDVCCGDGVFSLVAASRGARITVSDIAEENLGLVVLRAERYGVPIQTVAAAAEAIPLPDSSFSIITCAGGLSYLDHDSFFREVVRLLHPGGRFVFVDSLDHNPIYRLNRYIHFLRGRRTFSTLQRMPTLQTVALLRRYFTHVEVSYHGLFSFAAPLSHLVGEKRFARWSDAIDRALPFCCRMAFKIVGSAQRPIQNLEGN